MVDVGGSLWRRQILLYMRMPWRLLAILDPAISSEDAKLLVEEFLALLECDCDAGVTLVWWTQYKDCSKVELLAEGSQFRGALMLLALNKICDIEIECNFSRAASSRSYTRGKSHSATTMCTKHILAELHHMHQLTEQRKHDISSKCGLNSQQLI